MIIIFFETYCQVSYSFMLYGKSHLSFWANHTNRDVYMLQSIFKVQKSLNVAVSATKVKFLLLPLVSLNCSMFGCIFLLLWHFLLRSWAAQNPPLSLDATFLSIPSPVMPSCPLNCPHKHLCQCMYACVILLTCPYLNMSSMCGCLGMCSRIIYLWIH